MEICIEHPQLDYYGFYRRLNDDQCEDSPPCYELLSICSEHASKWLSIHVTDFQELMDKYIPEKKDVKKNAE